MTSRPGKYRPCSLADLARRCPQAPSAGAERAWGVGRFPRRTEEGGGSVGRQGGASTDTTNAPHRTRAQAQRRAEELDRVHREAEELREQVRCNSVLCAKVGAFVFLDLSPRLFAPSLYPSTHVRGQGPCIWRRRYGRQPASKSNLTLNTDRQLPLASKLPSNKFLMHHPHSRVTIRTREEKLAAIRTRLATLRAFYAWQVRGDL